MVSTKNKLEEFLRNLRRELGGNRPTSRVSKIWRAGFWIGLAVRLGVLTHSVV